MPTPEEIERLSQLPGMGIYNAAMDLAKKENPSFDVSAGLQTSGAKTNKLIAEQKKFF